MEANTAWNTKAMSMPFPKEDQIWAIWEKSQKELEEGFLEGPFDTKDLAIGKTLSEHIDQSGMLV